MSMKKTLITQLFLIIAFVSFSQTTHVGKEARWLSETINKYGKATDLFFLGNAGAYWSYKFINYSADTVQVNGYYKNKYGDSCNFNSFGIPEIMRFEDIVDITYYSGNPEIILHGKYGNKFSLVLNWKTEEDLKTNTIKILEKIILQNDKIGGKTDSLAEQKSILKQLRSCKSVTDKYIGIAGSLSESYRIAESLWNVSSVETLIKLTNDKSPVVRCYAFLGLIEKKVDYEVLKNIVDKHKKDNKNITTINGCIVRENETVISYMQTQIDYFKRE